MSKAEKYHSDLLDEILGSISDKEQKRVENKMILATKIANGLKAKGWSKTKLANEMGQEHTSVVTRWLSGTHNFTTDTLSDLEGVLGIKLLNTDEPLKEYVSVYHKTVQESGKQSSYIAHPASTGISHWKSMQNQMKQSEMNEVFHLSIAGDESYWENAKTVKSWII